MRSPRRTTHLPYPRGLALTAVAAAAVTVAGCGDDRPQQTPASPTAPTSSPTTAPVAARPDAALGLTASVPAALRSPCARLRATVGADLCPRLMPAGRAKLTFAQPQRGYARTFSIDASSGSLGRLRGKRLPAARGHWTITAVDGTQGRRLLAVFVRGQGAGPGRCRTSRSPAPAVRLCRTIGYANGGGYYGGHVSGERRLGRLVVQVSAHGYANAPRVLAMLRSVPDPR